MSIKKIKPDKSGIFVSSICIFHCIGLPLVLSVLPALGLQVFLHNPIIYALLFLFMILFAGLAFFSRWRIHKSYVPGVFMMIGVTLVAFGHFGLSHGEHQHHGHHHMMIESSGSMFLNQGSLVASLGGVLLILGHVLNQRKGSCCQAEERVSVAKSNS